jgi:hypothetical protein
MNINGHEIREILDISVYPTTPVPPRAAKLMVLFLGDAKFKLDQPMSSDNGAYNRKDFTFQRKHQEIEIHLSPNERVLS